MAIALALVNEPRLLLADEPTGEVDTATARVIYDIFHELNTELGLTTIIVSHDPGIARHVKRVVAVKDGKLASESMRRASTDGDETHVEWVVHDSAGRLQVPKDYLQRYNIHRRAELELTEHGILIRPVEQPDSPAPTIKADQAQSTTSSERKQWWSRWRKPGRSA